MAGSRCDYDDLLRASQYVPVDVPTEPTRVTRLLNSINTRDQFLISAIVEVKGDDGVNSKVNDFELAADYLLKDNWSKGSVMTKQSSALSMDRMKLWRYKDLTLQYQQFSLLLTQIIAW